MQSIIQKLERIQFILANEPVTPETQVNLAAQLSEQIELLRVHPADQPPTEPPTGP